MSTSFPLSAITDKDLRSIARDAHKAGWHLSLTNGNHVHWTAPNGKHFVTSLTPGSGKAYKIAKSKVRQLSI